MPKRDGTTFQSDRACYSAKASHQDIRSISGVNQNSSKLCDDYMVWYSYSTVDVDTVLLLLQYCWKRIAVSSCKRVRVDAWSMSMSYCHGTVIRSPFSALLFLLCEVEPSASGRMHVQLCIFCGITYVIKCRRMPLNACH